MGPSLEEQIWKFLNELVRKNNDLEIRLQQLESMSKLQDDSKDVKELE